jgi:transketolase
LICCKTIIGFGSPNKQGTAAVHGAPLGEAEIAASRKTLAWESAPFEIPEAIATAWNAAAKGASLENAWNTLFTKYRKLHPEPAKELERRMEGRLPADWSARADAEIAAIDRREAIEH